MNSPKGLLATKREKKYSFYKNKLKLKNIVAESSNLQQTFYPSWDFNFT